MIPRRLVRYIVVRTGKPEDSERAFEDAIETMRQAGFDLESWQFDSVFEWEVIIAVFAAKLK